MINRATFGVVDQTLPGDRRTRAAEVRRVVDELGDWSVGGGPLFRRLALALSRAMERGAVVPGARLPSERGLAGALQVSRGTAVTAYDLLVADGLVERRVGSGTFVVGSAGGDLPAGREGSALVARLVDRSAEPSLDLVDLSISVLHDGAGLPEAGVTTADLLTAAPDTGYGPWGRLALRRAVAQLLGAWGLPSEPEQIVITNGAQQALSLAASCWVRPGDRVALDDPTYPGALSTFTAAGAELLGMPVDHGGPRPEGLAEALGAHPAMAYLQTGPHSPTGLVLSGARRRDLAELLVASRVPLVEDLALVGLAWTPGPPPLAALVPDHPTAVVGSLSKLLWGGLRLGFVRASEPVALRFARMKATHDLGSSVVSQLLAERLLASPGLTAFLANRRAKLQGRYAVLARALRDAVPDWSWTEPQGGLSVWVRLPGPVAEAYAQVALRHGVAVATAGALSVTGAHRDRLRLSFAGPPDELREGVVRLAAAWAAFTGGAG
jgi:DNA-binding transcriptional MocR family regulator